MDMGNSTTSDAQACQISMLWNWYTVDACFVSTQWHIRSEGAFAATVICVFILVALVEGVRRAGREFDRRISRNGGFTGSLQSTRDLMDRSDSKNESSLVYTPRFRPTWRQQVIRGGFFFVQFGAAYILMLLAMYYNGYIIFAIILGGTAGHILFGRDTVIQGDKGESGASCC